MRTKAPTRSWSVGLDPGWAASMSAGLARQEGLDLRLRRLEQRRGGPTSAIRPSIRTAIRSDTLRANSRSCVTIIAVSDAPSALRLSTSSVISRAFVGSSPAVGSS